MSNDEGMTKPEPTALNLRLRTAASTTPGSLSARQRKKLANFLLAISGPMFILGKNCGAFANGNLSGALPEENPEQTPA
jgi:hypothetical protein